MRASRPLRHLVRIHSPIQAVGHGAHDELDALVSSTGSSESSSNSALSLRGSCRPRAPRADRGRRRGSQSASTCPSGSMPHASHRPAMGTPRSTVKHVGHDDIVPVGRRDHQRARGHRAQAMGHGHRGEPKRADAPIEVARPDQARAEHLDEVAHARRAEKLAARNRSRCTRSRPAPALRRRRGPWDRAARAAIET